MTAYPRAEMRAGLHPRCRHLGPTWGGALQETDLRKVLGEVKAVKVREFNGEVQSAF